MGKKIPEDVEIEPQRQGTKNMKISSPSFVCQYKKKFVVRQKALSERGMRERERWGGGGGGEVGSRETSSKTNWLEGPH